MTTYTLDDRLRIMGDIDQLRADARVYDRRARDAADDAAELRRVAHSLDDDLDRLDGVLKPVRDLHWPRVWIGDAATASRDRLDEHEIRTVAAVQVIGNLVADLRSEAAVKDRIHDNNERWRNDNYRDAGWLAGEIGYHNGRLL
jgi:hypothetical protein